MKFHTHNSRSGFTLVEVMVVVSIIASLSSVILVGVKAAQASGRDSVRGSSAIQVRNALALYQTDHNGVPAGGVGDTAVAGCIKKTVSNVTSWVCSDPTTVLQPLVDGKYISHIPVDVVNTNGLEYQYITADGAGTTNSNNLGTIATTQTASFGYVSELKSLDPVNNPAVVALTIGTADYTSYPSSGYPSASLVASPALTSFTGPSSVSVNSNSTWTATVLNPHNLALNYSVNWGDTTTSYNSSDQSVILNHSYPNTGPNTVTLTVTGYGTPVTASLSVIATPISNQTLTVNTAGATGFNYSLYAGSVDPGLGTVTSNPAGISCDASGSSCSSTFSNASSVTLSAVADPYYRFDGWSGACSGTNPTCSVNMNGAQAVTAMFDPIWGGNIGSVNWTSATNKCTDAVYGVQGAGNTTGWHVPTRGQLQNGLSNNPDYQTPFLSNTYYWTSDTVFGTSAYACKKDYSGYVSCTDFPKNVSSNQPNVKCMR